ncbi:MAG: hypothetical protein R2731_11445 [Nocardioides sp.]
MITKTTDHPLVMANVMVAPAVESPIQHVVVLDVEGWPRGQSVAPVPRGRPRCTG